MEITSLDEKKRNMMLGKYSVKILAYKEEDVKKFIEEVLSEIDHLNEKFEAIAMRANIETMAGKGLING